MSHELDVIWKEPNCLIKAILRRVFGVTAESYMKPELE
jgi:hypothetical protein